VITESRKDLARVELLKIVHGCVAHALLLSIPLPIFMVRALLTLIMNCLTFLVDNIENLGMHYLLFTMLLSYVIKILHA